MLHLFDPDYLKRSAVLDSQDEEIDLLVEQIAELIKNKTGN